MTFRVVRVDTITGEVTESRPPNAEEIRASLPDITLVTLLQRMVQAGRITQAEALAWVRDNTLPASVIAAIDGLATLSERAQAEIEARRLAYLPRMSIFISALQAAYALSDEQVDGLFTGE